MSSSTTFTIHIDGAARGNPGPAAFAFVIREGDQIRSEEAGCLGDTTNNIAEYTALVRALAHAAELRAKVIHVCSDSELLVKQMKGIYQVKNPNLRVLYDEAKDLIQSFDSVTLEHVPRAQNSHADRLCNEALDGAKSKSASPSPRPGKAKRKLAQEQAMREDALRWLNWAAGQWARGNPSDPPPADVWDHLWTILEDHGAVRPKP